MRTVLIFLLLLSAQAVFSQEQPKSKWALSFSFSPRLQARVPAEEVFREVNPIDIPRSEVSSIREFTIFGESRSFQRLPSNSVSGLPTNHDFWYSAALGIHRYLPNDFELSGNIYFAWANYFSEIASLPQTLPTENGLLYTAANRREIHLGSQVKGIYHFRQEKRVHPYFGGGLSVLLHQKSRSFTGQLYTGNLSQFINPDVTPFRDQTIDINIVATVGVLYRLSTSWSLGLEFNSRTAIGSGLTALQLRWQL